MPLHWAIIAAYALHVAYLLHTGSVSSLVANAALLPLNVMRLREMQALASDVSAVRSSLTGFVRS